MSVDWNSYNLIIIVFYKAVIALLFFISKLHFISKGEKKISK